MKALAYLIIAGITTCTLSTDCYAESHQENLSKSQLADAYLTHWFSVDSKAPMNLVMTQLPNETDRFELRFTSDDGHAVNGILALPHAHGATAEERNSSKLALLLHPMGVDQRFWWSDKSSLGAKRLTEDLLASGYRVITLDARLHGERSRAGFGPRELLTRAHSDEPRVYNDAIIGTVRDYRLALRWAEKEYRPSEILAIGYSMGAQMSLLLSSFEPSVQRIVAIVPPFISLPSSPVAPRNHLHRIEFADVLWLAGEKDPHSEKSKTQAAFSQIASQHKAIKWFDAGHRLPNEYLATVKNFVHSGSQEVAQ